LIGKSNIETFSFSDSKVKPEDIVKTNRNKASPQICPIVPTEFIVVTRIQDEVLIHQMIK